MDSRLHSAEPGPSGVGPVVVETHETLPRGTQRHHVHVDGAHGSLNDAGCDVGSFFELVLSLVASAPSGR